MYRIINTDGKELGITDSPIYIKFGSSGSFCPTSKEDAIGLSFHSEPYNLYGHDEIEGADTVIVCKIDGGDQIARQKAVTNQLVTSILEG